MVTYLCSHEYPPIRNPQDSIPVHTTPTMDTPELLATVPQFITPGRGIFYVPCTHDILYIVAHKVDQNGLIIAPKDIQDS